MKSINLIQNLNYFKDLKSHSDNDLDSPPSFAPKSQENEFSFSPEKSKQATGGLADILLKSLQSKPEPKPHVSKSPSDTKKSKSPVPGSFKPKLNPNSLKLVKKAEQEGKDLHKKKDPTPQPQPDEPKSQKKVSIKEFLERNYNKELSKLEGKKNSYPVQSLDRVDSQCTFKPVVDKNSRELAGFHKVDLYELAVRREEEKKSERMKELRKKEENELNQCTFTPKINKKVGFHPRNDDSRLTPDRQMYSKRYNRTFSPFS